MEIPKIVKNKYLITSVVFFMYMLLFDSNNIIHQIELINELKSVERERKYYLNEIETNLNTTEELLADIKKLERFAREKYLMKRADEDVFLMVRPKTEKVVAE